ncbi:hypothetical protein [Roseovarius mucosus]|uniref:hypothetical protein n=1 Tax=Roseovarius mucosus TaxID=215743 RepID=UPI00197D39DC|nr:hypothetical protein [Roseovarius mucosus]
MTAAESVSTRRWIQGQSGSWDPAAKTGDIPVKTMAKAVKTGLISSSTTKVLLSSGAILAHIVTV